MEVLRQVLLGPRSVAVVGASSDPFKTSGRPTLFLKQHGFDGDIWPINPNRSDVQGLPAFPDLRALPRVPDHAYIVLDADPALETLEEAVKLGVPLVSYSPAASRRPELSEQDVKRVCARSSKDR